MTIVLVTNLVQQARRLADNTAFLNDSRLVEVRRDRARCSRRPEQKLTLDYVSGNIG